MGLQNLLGTGLQGPALWQVAIVPECHSQKAADNTSSVLSWAALTQPQLLCSRSSPAIHICDLKLPSCYLLPSPEFSTSGAGEPAQRKEARVSKGDSGYLQRCPGPRVYPQ